jgi:cytochrome c oxidase cbb3-type subunit 3
MNNMKTKIGIILPLFIIVQLNWLFSQTTQPSPFYDYFLKNGWVFFTSFVVLGGFIALLNLLKVILKMQQIQIYKEIGKEAFEEAETQPISAIFNRWYKNWTRVVPQEKEHEIMFDHQYDGIRELDNSLPPWWVAMFYVTIIFAGAYMVYYHVADMGVSSQEAYNIEIKEANAEVKAYLATQANKVDENSATVLMDDASLSAAKSLYGVHCVACHGTMGEGGVGPNFTDNYWIHGGDIKSIFKTIKYGVPEKGMISWQAQLNPSDMQKLGSYILSMKGTNPPNGKEPQGIEEK